MPAQAPHRRNSATPSAQRRPAYGRGQNASPPGPKGPVPAQAPHRRKQRARHGLAPKGGVHRPAPAKLGHAICTTPARLRARPECLAPGAKRARCPPRPRTSETRPRHPQNAGPLKGEARMPRPRAQRARCPRGHAIRTTPARVRARPECLAPGPTGPGARTGTAPAIRGHALRTVALGGRSACGGKLLGHHRLHVANDRAHLPRSTV